MVLPKGRIEVFSFNGTRHATMSDGWMVISYPTKMTYLNLCTRIGTKVLRFVNANQNRE